MKDKKLHRNEDEMNFWQPASDMFSALMLILMLIILLLCLYLVHIPDHNQIDPYYGDSEGGSWGGEGNPTPSMILWLEDNSGGGGGEDGGASPTPVWEVTPSPTLTLPPTPTPTPDEPGSGGGSGGGTGGGNGEGEGPGDEPDMGLKSAVYVMLVDAETDRTVKEGGVEFELYGGDSANFALQILNSYYPDRLSYRFYETTEAGTFFFPEKLILGEYELHELTEAEGYDASDNLRFILADTYDWEDPFVVRVPVMPSKNTIRIQMVDSETGRGIPGGSFDVIAAENIITADGTLRCRIGQIVDEIVCDENGLGESGPLYLGQYTLRQREIPEYYAGILEELSAEVVKKSRITPAPESIPNQRTRLRLALTDELYPATGIAGAEYDVLSGRDMPLEMVTDASGGFLIDTLEKGATYRIRQTSATGNYRLNQQEIIVTVDALGYIDGETEKTVETTNRMIRVQIGITDEFGDVHIPGRSLALYTSQNELVYTWTTSGNPMSFDSLEPGAYYLIKGGDRETRYDIRVLDTAEIQTFNLHDTYVVHYLIYAGAALLTAGLATVLIVLSRRRRKRKQAAADGQN